MELGRYIREKYPREAPGHSGNQFALRYILDNGSVSSAVLDSITIEHLIENTKETEIKLPKKNKKLTRK